MAFKSSDDNDEDIMAEINMTPLIDIMLVLLIIFMVTSSVSLESGLDIDLPEMKAKIEAKKQNSAVIVSLLQDGRIAVQGKEVALENAKEAIKSALETEKTTLVILEGDRRSNLGNAVSLMDLAKEAGAEKFAIAADTPK